MNPLRMARYLSVSRCVAAFDDGRRRFALPHGRPSGRFAAYAGAARAAPTALDAERAAAAESVGLPRRHARAIIF